MAHILLDMDRCTGHGRCYTVAPDLFEDDDEGRPILLISEVTGEAEERARNAAAACPEIAIVVAESR